METDFPVLENAQAQLVRERVLADLKSLARDGAALLRLSAGDASEKARVIRTQLASLVAQATACATELSRQGVAAARHAARQVDRSVRANPYRAAAIGFGAGFILSLLLNRRRNGGPVNRRDPEPRSCR